MGGRGGVGNTSEKKNEAGTEGDEVKVESAKLKAGRTLSGLKKGGKTLSGLKKGGKLGSSLINRRIRDVLKSMGTGIKGGAEFREKDGV
ncbi:hypothetical protein chiPu_0027147 [Chiloscyllium punctatum]|uniref:Uncharacterized protein n=1 Tax=Chiloscyllium punctatum TaxID=137246 RepID=A0A401TJS1_CHIPU|nr:hypothetical protein [Chiloscyllium punctatum]